jgi:hypothetical protein
MSRTKILMPYIFVATRHLVLGEFDKMKARFVTDGRDQDVNLCLNTFSPTVAIHSVFTALGMAVAKPSKALQKQFAPIGTPAIAGLEGKLVVGYILH